MTISRIQLYPGEPWNEVDITYALSRAGRMLFQYLDARHSGFGGECIRAGPIKGSARSDTIIGKLTGCTIAASPGVYTDTKPPTHFLRIIDDIRLGCLSGRAPLKPKPSGLGHAVGDRSTVPTADLTEIGTSQAQVSRTARYENGSLA